MSWVFELCVLGVGTLYVRSLNCVCWNCVSWVFELCVCRVAVHGWQRGYQSCKHNAVNIANSQSGEHKAVNITHSDSS